MPAPHAATATPLFCHVIPRALLVVSALAAFLGACQTAQQSTPFTARKSFHGQLHYASANASSVGETVVALGADGTFQLEFVAGPGFPLLRMNTDGYSASAEGVFARGRWSGRSSSAPEQLRSWLLLRDVFAQAELASGTARRKVRFSSRVAPTWEANAEFSGRKLRLLRVRFATGERFAFQFAD